MAARDKLNARQRDFVWEFVWGPDAGNGSECARRAGFKDKEPAHAAHQLRRKPQVRAAIEKESAEKREQMKQRVLASIDRQIDISIARPLDILNADGKLLPFNQWKEHAKLSVASIEVEDLYEGSGMDREHIGVLRKIKFHDPTPPARLAAQWAGELTEKIKVEGGFTLEQLVPKNKPQSTEGSK